jgi:hypothetical protein
MGPRKSRRGMAQKAWRSLAFSLPRLGQSEPPHCPTQCPQLGNADPLGAPLTIRGAAAIIGCSTWTIRQKYLPMGLPHFRVRGTGKLTFYKNQITRWLLAQQEKGGMI